MQKIKSFLFSTLGIFIFLIVACLSVYLFGMLMRGGLSIAARLFPLITDVAGITLAVFIFILLPLSFIPFTYRIAATGIFITVAIFSFSTWVWCALLTYSLWGGFALVIGLLFAAIGVIPMALLATIFNGMWSQFGQIFLMIFLIIGLNIFGSHVAQKAEQRKK